MDGTSLSEFCIPAAPNGSNVNKQTSVNAGKAAGLRALGQRRCQVLQPRSHDLLWAKVSLLHSLNFLTWSQCLKPLQSDTWISSHNKTRISINLSFPSYLAVNSRTQGMSMLTGESEELTVAARPLGIAPSLERPQWVVWKQWGLARKGLEVPEKRGHRGVKGNHQVKIFRTSLIPSPFSKISKSWKRQITKLFQKSVNLMCPPKMPVIGVWTKSAWRVTEVLFLGPTCSHSSSLPSPGSSCSSSFSTWLLGPLEIVSSEKQTVCLGYYLQQRQQKIKIFKLKKRKFYMRYLQIGHL